MMSGSEAKRHHLLVVDDDPMILESLEMLLESRYRVSKAADAPQALAVLRSNEVSAVVADDRMPGESGVELLTWVHAHRPGVVRFLLTGYTETDQVIRAINQAGIFHYIRKPWDNTELVNLIARGLELKESQAALERSERVYRDLFHHAHVGIVRLELDGRIIEANRSFASTVGRDPEELVDMQVSGLCDPPSRWDELVTELFLNRSVTGQELALKGPAGSVAHVLVNGALRSEASGRRVVEATTLDLTEQRRALEESAELREVLGRVQRHESLATLSMGLLHDISNQLTVILAAATTYRERVQGEPEAVELMEDLVKASLQAGELTSQLVQLGRASDGVFEAVDLNAIVARVGRLLSHGAAPDRRVRLELEGGLGPVTGSAVLLGQAVLNLGLNGLDAMPGGGTLTIATRSRPAPGGTSVELLVRDTGVGIAPDDLERIFEPHFTTKRLPWGFGGSGLGLAMVQSIVKRHRGTIEVESAPGHGSRFTIRLEGARTEVLPRERRERPVEGHGLVVLADDEPGIRKGLGGVFVAAGYRVLKAATGLEAVELVENNPEVTVVVLDVIMPVMGGEEAFGRIRELRPGLPVLFMTPHAGSDCLRSVLEQAATGLLRKPFSPYEIASAVAELLTRAR